MRLAVLPEHPGYPPAWRQKEEAFVAEQSAQGEGLQGGGEGAPEQESFKPVGTLFLLVIYILIFAAAWGLVYFNELLARR